MARKRIAGTRLDSWEGVDQALKSIGRLDIKLFDVEHDMNLKIIEAKEKAKRASEPLLEKKAALELAIKEFTEAHRDEFKKQRMRRLTFGSVSFRLSTKIIVRSAQKCVDALKSLGLGSYIRTKESPDKEAMKALDDETLKKVGARRKTEDAFGYEVDFEKIKEAI